MATPMQESEGWEKKPYGLKKELGSKKIEMIILPGESSASGIDKDKLDVDGLRDHEDRAWEKVKHVGYIYGRG